MKAPFLFILLVLLFCSCTNSEAIPIAENTFVLNDRVYSVIDNEVTEIANLNKDTISKTLKPELQVFGDSSLDYVKKGARTELSGVYRGNVLFIKMELYGLNDLREKYNGNGLSINLKDEHGFNLQTLNIAKSEMTQIIGVNGETSHFSYDAGIPMNPEVYKAISSYDVSSSLSRNNW